MFGIIFHFSLFEGNFANTELTHSGVRWGGWKLFFMKEFGETISYERIWQVVKNASLWNRECSKKFWIVPCLFIEFSHYISYWNFLPVPHEIEAWLWLNNVWNWITDRPAKICKILIEGLFNMSFWEVSGKLCDFCVKKIIWDQQILGMLARESWN